VTLIFIRVCAVLIGLRSLTNFAKLSHGSDAVLVFFGQMLHGNAAFIPALGVGLFMLATAIAMWKPSTLALPLMTTYAVFVLINLVSFVLSNPEQFEPIGARISSATEPNELRWLGMVAMLVYSALAMATTAGPAWLLWKRRNTPRR
jgi:hypothetical protein